MLYLAPGVSQVFLPDASIPTVIAEGEFKTPALWRLANHGSPHRPRFLPLGVSSVYNWRGTIGKTVGPGGGRLGVKGAIPDLDWVAWEGRRFLRDLAGHAAEDVRRHVWDSDPRQNQKACVVGEEADVAPPCFAAPTDEVVAARPNLRSVFSGRW
jgi:hypothetical protein